MQPTARARLLELLREKSVRQGEFQLASGRMSDFYVDVRQTSLHAEGSRLIALGLIERLRDDVVGVGGMSLGADPLACSVAAISTTEQRPLHAFLIRKEAKGHGTARYVEGLANLPPGSRVAIVEDTTTTGGSLLRAVARAQEAGLVVVQCLTVVEREEGAALALREHGFTLEALTTRTELLS